MDTVIQFLLENYPLAGIVILLVLITAIAVWKFKDYHHSIKNSEEKIKNLPCEQHRDDLLKVYGLKDIVESTNNIVIDISRWIMKLDSGMIDVLAKKSSPLKITPVGYIVLEKSTGRSIVDNNLEFFINELNKNPLNTSYDVEKFAFDIMLKNMSNEIFNSLKNFIYYSPEVIEITNPENQNDIVKVKISLTILLQIMGLYLRDKYLELNPKIEQEK
jgi:hypothetical protein